MTPTNDQPDYTNPGGNLEAQWLHNVAVASARNCAIWNANAVGIYYGAFDQWVVKRLNHPKLDAGPMPVPPMAYELKLIADPTSGPGSGGAYGDVTIMYYQPVIGNTPVCPALPVPAIIKAEA